jgi:hypothetical protein
MFAVVQRVSMASTVYSKGTDRPSHGVCQHGLWDALGVEREDLRAFVDLDFCEFHTQSFNLGFRERLALGAEVTCRSGFRVFLEHRGGGFALLRTCFVTALRDRVLAARNEEFAARTFITGPGRRVSSRRVRRPAGSQARDKKCRYQRGRDESLQWPLHNQGLYISRGLVSRLGPLLKPRVAQLSSGCRRPTRRFALWRAGAALGHPGARLHGGSCSGPPPEYLIIAIDGLQLI